MEIIAHVTRMELSFVLGVFALGFAAGFTFAFAILKRSRRRTRNTH